MLSIFFVKAVSKTYTFILKGIEEVSSHLSVLSGGPRLVAHTQVTGRVLFQKVSNANNKVFLFWSREIEGEGFLNRNWWEGRREMCCTLGRLSMSPDPRRQWRQTSITEGKHFSSDACFQILIFHQGGKKKTTQKTSLFSPLFAASCFP